MLRVLSDMSGRVMTQRYAVDLSLLTKTRTGILGVVFAVINTAIAARRKISLGTAATVKEGHIIKIWLNENSRGIW